ncbi:MAG: TorF family putative porin [Rhodanobacteraceae bacterium]
MSDNEARRRRVSFRRHVLHVLVLVVLAVASLRVEAGDLTGEVALGSQLADRGVAITSGAPVLQGALAWNTPSGWSLGVSAGAQTRSPGRVVESNARVSHYWSLSGDWQMQASLLYYHYSGIWHASAYEADIGWIYRDVLTFGVSGIHAFGENEHRFRAAVDLDLRWPLGYGFSLSAGAGLTRYMAGPYGNRARYDYSEFHYFYGSVGVSWSHGPWRMEIDHMMLSHDVRQRLGEFAVSPWMATITRSF